MTAQGHQRTIFGRAIKSSNLVIAEMTARELGRLSLDESLALTALVARHEPTRRSRFAVRWLERLLAEDERLVDRGGDGGGVLSVGSRRPIARPGVRDARGHGRNGFGQRSTIAVKNGALRHFESGIATDGASDSIRITDVVASGNTSDGIFVFGDSASIKSVTASGNGNAGIDVLGASASITSSTASGNVTDGIDVNGALALIKSVTAAGNAGEGISVLGASASITSSTASGNGGIGILVNGASVSIKSSNASGNGGHGIFVNGASASITSSTASGNALNGIGVGGASASIGKSTASGNGLNGISVNSDAATIKTNRAQANGFPAAASDLTGLGISVIGYTTPPVGTNTVLGNDNPAECAPASLC